MRTTFQQIAKTLGIPFVFVEQLQTPDDFRPPMICFNRHSDFSRCEWILDHEASRVFHLIRDPRDVIISAMHYHLGAKEAWLKRSRREFGGLSYQEKLNRLPSDHARYVFEMHHNAGRVIRAMLAWDYTRLNSYEQRYETLVCDFEAEAFSSVVAHLGFASMTLKLCREKFVSNSLFGGLQTRRTTHVRCGKNEQWKNVFDLGLAREFLADFGTALIDLGYESDDAWIDACATRFDGAQVTPA